IIFDLDGTAVPNKKDGMPSQSLIDLVQKIKDKIFVSAATGRRIFECRSILNSLQLTSPCIILGGTQILDPVSEKILWEKLMPIETVKKIITVAKVFDYKLYMSNEAKSSLAIEKIITGPENIIYIMDVNKNHTDVLLNKLSEIPDITAHPVPSYTPENFDIHITHKDATKKQALEILFDILKVNKEEVMGFGDGNNDLPIFEAVGYKVAMGNASPELKNIADFIAQSAKEDGLAKAVERLVI
ncbi:MAG: HAD family hydrolase, partial [Candidatus Buchananbacteria bacterium]|nr:HAD family hydrolase [Candidatus Buchananbacteria bacterium]